jgi:hypothetical protein
MKAHSAIDPDDEYSSDHHADDQRFPDFRGRAVVKASGFIPE